MKTKSQKQEFYRHPTFGHVYGHKLVTPVGRISWPYLVTPKEGMEINGEKTNPRFEATLLLDAKSSKVKEFIKKLEDMCEGMVDVFNSGGKKKAITMDADNIEVLKDGNEFDTEKYAYYKNTMVLQARNAERPNLISLNKDAKGNFEEVEPSFFKSGLLCRFVTTPIITVHGMSFKLEDIQLVRDDGVRFGGGGKQDSSGLLEEAEDELKDFLDDSDDLSVSSIDDDEDEELDEDELEEVAQPKKRGRPAKASSAAKSKDSLSKAFDAI